MRRIRFWLGSTVACVMVLFPGLAPGHQELEEQIERVTLEIGKAPEDAVLHARRANLYRRHQEWEKALEDYGKAAQLDPKLESIPLGRAQLELDRERPDAALKEVLVFLAEHPKSGTAYLIAARGWAATEETEKAVEAYTKAIAHLQGPQPDHYLERSAVTLGNGGKPDSRAVAGLDEGIQRLGDVAGLLLRAVEIERSLGMVDAALDRVDGVLEKRGNVVSWLILRAEILEEAGRLEQTAQAWERADSAMRQLPVRRRNTAAAVRWRERIAQGLKSSKLAGSDLPTSDR